MTRAVLLILGFATLPLGYSSGAKPERDAQRSTNELSWFNIGGGGATRLTAGAFEMTCTIGQSGVTSVALTAGQFELSGGFIAGALASTPLCPADINNDGAVNPQDLALLLGAWGINSGHPADFNDDGVVNAADLALLLGGWGTCE